MQEFLQAYCLDLMRAGRQWRRLADAVVRPHGLSEATALPLILIGRHDGIRQNALAEAMGVEGPSLVRSLDQLCAAGLVTREADISDRRARQARLTERGWLVAARMGCELDAQRRRIFGDLNLHDLQASMRVFQRLATAEERPADSGAETVVS